MQNRIVIKPYPFLSPLFPGLRVMQNRIVIKLGEAKLRAIHMFESNVESYSYKTFLNNGTLSMQFESNVESYSYKTIIDSFWQDIQFESNVESYSYKTYNSTL